MTEEIKQPINNKELVKDKKQVKTSPNKPKRDKGGRLLPGNTANLKGRPEGSLSLVSLLKQELIKNMPVDATQEEKITYAQAVIKKYLKKAIKDEDVNILKDMINRTDGMPKQSIEATHRFTDMEDILISVKSKKGQAVKEE